MDRDEVLDRPLYIKQDSGNFSFPSKVKCPMPCIITQPKVKVHFLGLKKVSIKQDKIHSAVSSLWYIENWSNQAMISKPMKTDWSIPDLDQYTKKTFHMRQSANKAHPWGKENTNRKLGIVDLYLWIEILHTSVMILSYLSLLRD